MSDWRDARLKFIEENYPKMHYKQFSTLDISYSDLGRGLMTFYVLIDGYERTYWQNVTREYFDNEYNKIENLIELKSELNK